jgi:hypothetical protein
MINEIGRDSLCCEKHTHLDRIHASILEEARIWRDAGKTKAFDLLHRPREPD